MRKKPIFGRHTKLQDLIKAEIGVAWPNMELSVLKIYKFVFCLFYTPTVFGVLLSVYYLENLATYMTKFVRF
jgi:hypothetical protein